MDYLHAIEQTGVLPTFFPEDLSIEMNSPLDVAEFIANVMVEEVQGEILNSLPSGSVICV